VRIVYTIGIYLYSFIAKLLGLFNDKAKLWTQGRKNLLQKIKSEVSNYQGKTIWIHSASLGEFEQGRPLIEAIKEKNPETRIIITFFSPSGYEIRKDYPLADHVFYLPVDTPQNAQEFLSIINPDISIFIKYEFWYNYLNELQRRSIPYIFISAIFRPNQLFFKPYGTWFLKHLMNAQHFFVQNEISKQLLNEAGIQQVSISGDTRFDRVIGISKQAKENPLVNLFKDDKPLLLGGSTWPKDEKYLQELLEQFPELKIIIAPHLIDQAHIDDIISMFKNSVRYSEAEERSISKYQVLVIDNMGLLSSLYQYADYALIGGGFGVGIHNTLEAATFGMPIFIGPNYEKFQEAKDLIEEEVVFVFHDGNELKSNFSKFWNQEKERVKVKQAAIDYVQSKSGATEMILEFVL
jgi:3-deoxy-D-manno-octulosonic-acid transferase